MKQDQTVRQLLLKLAYRHHSFMCNISDRYELGLKDGCASFKRERELIVMAINCEIVSEMLRLRHGLIPSLLLPKLTRWLMRQTGIDQGEAAWTVNSWAMAFGIISFVDEDLPSACVSQPVLLN